MLRRNRGESPTIITDKNIPLEELDPHLPDENDATDGASHAIVTGTEETGPDTLTHELWSEGAVKWYPVGGKTPSSSAPRCCSTPKLMFMPPMIATLQSPRV